MSFLNNVLDRAVENKFIMVDDHAPPSCFTRYLASMMLDYCRICQVGHPTNFFIPPYISYDGAYEWLCGVRVVEHDGLIEGGDLLTYFVNKYSKDWNYDYALVLATSHANGLLGIIKK